jgi:hypothetical protein
MTEAWNPERIARNEAAFRDANERIENAAEAIGGLDEIPFVCECALPKCTELARLSLEDYERVRSHGTTFWVVPGHEITHVDGVEVARIVDERPAFTVLEKVGEPGRIAEELDPRGSVPTGGA